MPKSFLPALLAAVLLAAPAAAQFTGPGAAGASMGAAEAAAARPGTYVTLEGSIVSRLREDYYLFRDASGEVRVEIEPRVFAGRPVAPETRIRLVGEVDRSVGGATYIWIETLEIVN